MRNVLFLPLLFQLLTSLAIARLGSVEQGLQFELSQCVFPNGPSYRTGICTEFGNNVIQWLGCVSSCWRTSLLKCTEHHNREADVYMYVYKDMMCGVLNTGMHRYLNHLETFFVYCNFDVHLKFLEFNLPSSERCAKARVTVASRSQRGIHYCGRRVPWTVTLTESKCNIHIYQLNWLKDGFYFILVYETIEKSSPLAIIMDEVYVMFIQGDHCTVSIGYSLFGNDHNNLLPGRLLYFLSHILDVVCLDIIPDSDTILYDGPGKLSPKTVFTDEEQISGDYIRHCFSKFVGSAHISTNTHQSVIWFTEVNVKTSYSCKNYSLSNDTHNFSVYDSGSGVHCMWHIKETPEEIQLHEVEFYGFDVIVTFFQDETLEKLCQYGGLYVLYRHDGLDWNVYEQQYVRHNAITYLSLCNTIRNHPTIRVPHHLTNIIATYFVFTTFQKYSIGSVYISYTKLDCKGHHYEFHTCDKVNKGFGDDPYGPYYYEDKKRRDWWRNSDDGVPSCKAIWNTNNLNYYNFGYYCSIVQTFQSLSDVFMTGPQHIVINNWIIPKTQNTADTRQNDFYNFHLNATVLKNFPVDMTELQHNVIVPRDHEVSAFLPHLRSLVLSTNHTDGDFHATVIRIKLYQNLICTQQQSYHVIEDVIHVFLTAERITSRIVQYFESSEEQRERYCIQYKRGHLSENKVTTQSVAVIDQVFLNHSYGFTSQQLDTIISIKMHGAKTCLAHCKLDIYILGSLKLNLNADDIHHYVWKQVKYLMWRGSTNECWISSAHKQDMFCCLHSLLRHRSEINLPQSPQVHR